MKKHLLIAFLAITLTMTAVACGGEDKPKETAGETAEESIVAVESESTDESLPAESVTEAETPGETEPTETGTPESTPPETQPTETTPEVTQPTDTQPEVTQPADTQPEVTQPADTQPEDTQPTETKPVETKPVETKPTEPEDLNAPIAIFDADDLNITDGANKIESMTRTDNYLTIVPIDGDPHYTPIRYEDGGRFIAIKYRAFNAKGMSIQIYPGSIGEAPTDDSNSLRTPAIYDGEWHLAIFDTASIDPILYDGSYVSYLRFDPLDCDYILNEAGEPYKENDAWVRHPKPDGAYIDVQYIAFFHSQEAAEMYDAQPNHVLTAEDLLSAVQLDSSGVDATLHEEEGYVNLTATAGDPQFMAIPAGSIPELSGKFIAFRYRTEASDATAEFFVGSGGGPVAGTTQASFRYITDGDWHLMVVDISGVADLTGYINFLRFDIFNKGPNEAENLVMDIQYIAIFDSADQARAYDMILNPIPDNSNSFASDITTQTEGNTLDISDLGDGFVVELPLGGSSVEMFNETLVYNMTSISDMHAVTDGAYFVKINLLDANANGALVVRGNGVMNSDEVIEKFDPSAGIYKINNFYETDGAGSFGGSGVYARLDGGMLKIRVKTYDAAAISRVKNTEFGIEAPGTELCIIDDGTSLHFLVDGKKYAEIVLSGKRTYDDIQEINCSVSNVFAKKAVIMTADGEETVLENTLITASFHAQIGVVSRSGVFRFTSIAFGPASAVVVPPMEQTVIRQDVAQGKPVTADSVENETNIPANATDGDPGTRWGALPTGVANLTIDLTYTYTIDQIYVSYENSVLPHTVSISVDGENFTTVYESPSRGAGDQIIRFDATDARYVRFTREGDAPEGSNWFSIYEVRVMAVVPEEGGPVMWDEKKDVILHQSFDELRLNAVPNQSVFTPGDSANWDKKAVLTADITSLYYHGWIAVKGETGKLGYQIDDQDPVYSDAFFAIAEQGVLDAAAILAPKADSVHRTAVSIDLRNVFGAHKVQVFYVTPFDQVVILCEFSLEMPERVKPAHDYVSDGLVSMYNQHNLGADSTVWWDNVGDNNMTITLNDKSYLADDGLHTEGTKHNFPAAIVDVVNGDAFTIEILLGDFICLGKDYNTFMNSSNDNFALFRRVSSNELEFKFAANAGTDRHKIADAEALLPNTLITITYTVGGDCTIYIDGVAAATKASPNAMGANDLFIGHSGAKDFNTVYQSIRFYDRALSADEVLANAKVDGRA